jgi:glycosyltransferase involved in cell wall biosynthesis
MISVLLPAYNAERYLLHSVNSVLAQTYEDFELIVVNDGSTDRTRELLAGISDPRLRILDNPMNLGIVASLNRAQSEARGQYIARIDADDMCLPRRFAMQKQFLDTNPGILLLGTGTFNLVGSRINPGKTFRDPDPVFVRWMSHIDNPIVHSSMMFRAEAITSLSQYLRENMRYCEDFDLLHRLFEVGDISLIPERLVIYRQHDQMLTRIHREEMIAKTATVLKTVYADLLGRDNDASATLVAKHFVARQPVREGAVLEQLASILEGLISAFIARYDVNAVLGRRVINHAASLWWDTLLVSTRAGAVTTALRYRNTFRWSHEVIPSRSRVVLSLTSGILPGKQQLKHLVSKGAAAFRTNSPLSKPQKVFELKGVRFETLAFDVDEPPRLYVIVDTEEEFDWNGPLDRKLTSVRSMAAQERAQAIFDSYGLRPIYVLDYAVASQPEGYEPLREIFDRHACAIGAHLHPWITPPFSETVSEYNSYGGNLPPALEEAKLRCLVAAIRNVFEISPIFFKAGRYGIGPSTVETLARLGFAVDFSMLPGADLRLSGGADFRFIEARPCRAIAHDILTIPMTRGKIGVLAWLPNRMDSLLEFGICRKLRIPGILARAGLVNVVTLTPEGVSAEEQIRLVRSLTNRGHRVFAMHYHSPSLVPGNTPYVRTERELGEFLSRIERVCGFFFGELAGVPGNPADLVPSQMRNRIWPRSGRPESF